MTLFKLVNLYTKYIQASQNRLPDVPGQAKFLSGNQNLQIDVPKGNQNFLGATILDTHLYDIQLLIFSKSSCACEKMVDWFEL